MFSGNTIPTPAPRIAGRGRSAPSRSAFEDGFPGTAKSATAAPSDAGVSGLSNRKQRVVAIIITVYALFVPMVLLLIELVRIDPPVVVMVWLDSLTPTSHPSQLPKSHCEPKAAKTTPWTRTRPGR